jgi:hypothetical protein
MAKHGYDQTYDDDRKENEETRALVKKAVMAPINAIKPKATKTDTGETTNPMGDKYKKGGKVMKKMKKYNGEEGSEVEFETKTGKNKMIDDDTRIKAEDYANLDVDAEPRITKDAPKTKSSSPKGAKAFTRAETGGGAALMTRKDRSGMPKAKAKSSSYTSDHTMGMAMKKGGSVKSASARADGCAIRGKTRA